MWSWFYLQIAYVSGFTTQGFDRPAGLSTETSFVVLLGTILNWFLGFVGTLAFIMFVWAGFSFVISRGNAEKVKKARTIMTYSLTGIVIILLAYAAIFTITHYLATGQMTEDTVTNSDVIVPVAIPVSPQAGTVQVNPATLGNPHMSGQPAAAVPVDSRLIQINPTVIGNTTARNGVPVGDSIQINPIR